MCDGTTRNRWSVRSLTSPWVALGALLLGVAALGACSSSDSGGASAGNGVPSPDAGGDGATSQDGGGTSEDAGTDATEDSPVSDATGGDAAPPTGPCSALPNPVYIESGDTQQNLLKDLGRKLRDSANVTLVFNLTGSCTLTNDLYTGAKMVPNGTLEYIPSTAEDPNWTSSKPEATCTTDADGAPIDVGISALFVESCGLGAPPPGSGLALVQGPVQAYTFVVPEASSQTAISAEEAYYTFGFGNANPLAPAYDPWNDETAMFIRPPTKSTLVATAMNIGLPPNKWKGQPKPASSDVVTAVATSSKPDATIGILGSEVYDSNRGKGLEVLAFQWIGQEHAFFPDSTATAYDKQNVRDGHYALWSPTVYITKANGAVPSNPLVAYFMDLVLGHAAAPPDGGATIDGLASVVKVGLIPDCAMQVKRATDGGPVSLYAPPEPCTCYFLSKISGASGTPAGCTACTSPGDCATGTCSHGFCEPDTSAGTPTGPAGCVSSPANTNTDILNACTSAQAVDETVVLPTSDGGLLPLP